MLDSQVLEDRLDDQVGLREVDGPRGHAVGEAHYGGEVCVTLVLGHALLLELAVEILRDLRLASAEPRHVLVLEQHAVVLDR